MSEKAVKKALCLIYNTAPHYRSVIFQAIDRSFDCEWYFGKTKTDIREMDLSLLKCHRYYKSYGNPNKMYWQGALVSSLFKRKFKNYFILTQSRSLSMWVMILLKSLFFPKKTIYGWSHGWYGREGRLHKALDRWRIKNMAGQFVYNERARNLMIEGGVPKDKVFVIANSLDYYTQIKLRERLKKSDIYSSHFKNENSTIVFIGRLTYVKKLGLLIDAVKALHNRGIHYNVVLIGTGEAADSLKEEVKAAGLERYIWFYGACYDEMTNAELIYNADLCVSPGNVGLTAMHCMVFGTPVITNDDFNHQMPEFEAIRPGVTGDFFRAGCADSLAETIENWFAWHDDRECVRRECYREIDTKWNPDYQMEQIRKHLILS